MSDNTRRVFRVVIDTENAAFGNHPGEEIARILQNITESFETTRWDAPSAGEFRDINGNRVGSWSFLNESHADRVRALEMELDR